MQHQCQICGQGNLVQHTETEPVHYRGKDGSVPLHFSVCEYCGSETASEDDLRSNKRAVVRFRKAVDGLMTGEAIREFRKRYGITQAVAAKVFGGGPVAFSKYENDDVMQSESMDKLLRLAAALPPAFAWLCNDVGEKRLANEVVSQVIESIRKMAYSRAPKFFLEANRFSRMHVETREFSSTFISSSSANDQLFLNCGNLG